VTRCSDSTACTLMRRHLGQAAATRIAQWWP